MLKAVVFKEWLKIRWVFIGMLLINFLVIINTYFNVSNVLKVYSANVYLVKLITYEILFFDDLMYIPLLTGILISVFQFFPEINQKRLKLTFHLPVQESKMLFQMTSIGFISLLLIFLFDTFLLSLVSLNFFPDEVFKSMIITLLPWFFTGFCGYFLITMVFIEPNWTKRVVVTLIGIGLISLFYSGSGYAKFEQSWWMFMAISSLFGVIIYVSAYNFKRGIS